MHPNLVSTLKHMVITPVRVEDDLNMAPGSSDPSSLYHQMSNATIFMSSALLQAAAPAIDQQDSHDLLPNIGTSCGFFDCALQLHSDEITNNIIIPENHMIDLLQLQHDTDHDHTGNACTTSTASSSKLISTTDHEHAEREITMLVKQQQVCSTCTHHSRKL
jgi:tRNA A-37 threonylcarbamoyl transferase component Bud32